MNRFGQDLNIKKRTLNFGDGSSLCIVGLSCLQVRIGNQSISHHFFDVKNLDRNLILGRDWLIQKWGKNVFRFGKLKNCERLHWPCG